MHTSAAKAFENESYFINLLAYINHSKVLLYPIEKRRCNSEQLCGFIPVPSDNRS